MKWAPVPWKSSDFAPRGISFPEKLCYTTDITVKFLPFCQPGFVSAIPAPPQTSLRRKPSPKALPHKALGGHDHYLHFPVRGRKRVFTYLQSDVVDHYLHFPVRGRKPCNSVPADRVHVHYYLHFPVRGRKREGVSVSQSDSHNIIIYISP